MNRSERIHAAVVEVQGLRHRCRGRQGEHAPLAREAPMKHMFARHGLSRQAELVRLVPGIAALEARAAKGRH